MRSTLFVVLFVAAVSANPFAWAAPQASLVPTVSTTSGKKHNATHKLNRTRTNPHKEPTPTFKVQQACDCAQVIVPMNLLSENEKCLMNHAAAVGCYLGSAGACASPTPACGLAAGIM